ncbi:MAG: site-specific integrase [Gammaproteobacteria bacterium]|nr:site-specific integrase [Gammaproteobacteria bacterium]
MGRRTTMPGLQRNKSGNWHIDKKVFGSRICESTGTSNFEEAERYLARRIEDVRQAVIYGVRLKRTFREAATKYLDENAQKASIGDDAYSLRTLDKYIGNLPLENIHMGTLQQYIKDRKAEKVKNRTINAGLQVTRHILNLASGLWIDENGLTWLQVAPKIKLLPEIDKRKPHPLSKDEQGKLFQAIPEYLRKMALFAVNTGCRDQEVCNLRWEWEVLDQDLNIKVFIIPGYAQNSKGELIRNVKNGQDKLIVLNKVASQIVEEMRGQHATYVFTYNDKPLYRLMTGAWKRARVKVGLPDIRIHDLRHTFGKRLRAAGVSFEDRQDLLGHKSERITTDYSAAELKNLWIAVNKICDKDVLLPPRKPKFRKLTASNDRCILSSNLFQGSRESHEATILTKS